MSPLPFLIQLFESTLVCIGNELEDIVASQRRQLELGVKVAPDLIQMVKRFHQRWNELKRVITDRRSSIERGLQKYDLEILGIACEFDSDSTAFTAMHRILS